MFKDKVVLVTGSSMGIGKEIAKSFASAGATVLINSRDASRAQACANEIIFQGFKAEAVAADVASISELSKMISHVREQYGTIDILVNNAGRWLVKPSFELTEEDWDDVLDLNLKAPFFCCQKVGLLMQEKGGGSIINIASVMGKVFIPMRVAYGPAKAGLMAMTCILASEWAPYNIRVNAVAPGFVLTETFQTISEEGKELWPGVKERTPMGTYISMGDVAEAVLFLASDKASRITGQTLFVDGGWTAYGGWR